MLLFLPQNSQGGCQALLYPMGIELCPGFGAGGWGSRSFLTASGSAHTPGTAAGGQYSSTATHSAWESSSLHTHLPAI